MGDVNERAPGKVVTVKAAVQVPRVPNFLHLSDGQTLPVEAVGEDGLRAIGAAWTDALVENAARRGGVPHG